jgi:amino acid adenylation domain-containing protein
LLVDDFLAQSAVRHADRVALVCGDRRLTYRDLEDATNRFAHGLMTRGIRRGDVVVIHLENSVEAIVSIFGTLRLGAVFVPIGPTVKADKLAYILNDSGAAALVADARADAVLAVAVKSAPALRAVILVGDGSSSSDESRTVPFDDVMNNDAAGAAPSQRIDLDLAALIYTSGSTGQSKGVMLTHANMVAAATSINSYLRNTEQDVILDVLPLSFDYGLYQVFLAFQAGARLILERSFVYPSVMLELLERERVTALPIVPTLAALLLKHDLGAFGSSLRYITNTGACLPPPHIFAFRRQLPHVRIFSMYGLTECKRVSYLAPDDVEARPTSVGKPMDNVEVFVADENGNLSSTGVGELVVRGSNVMSGYWNAPDATAHVLREGPFPGQYLLRTGDKFRIDEDGFLYFIGRLDDMIKSRGQRVSPKEVESSIYALPAVTGAAVVGTPDPILGMAITAFVTITPHATLSEQDVIRHCAQELEDFMVPKTVRFVDQLPKTESGKIDHRRLVALHK